MRHVIFVDTESNGLDPRVHDVWEAAWWNLTTGQRGLFLPYIPDVGKFLANGVLGDMEGLRKCRFVDRWTTDYRSRIGYGQAETQWALEMLWSQLWPTGQDAQRSVIVCAQPKHDLPFLAKMFAEYAFSSPDPWFYRATDLGSYAVGKLDLPEDDPPGAATVAKLVGVAPGDHTAAGDVTSGGRCFLLLREFGRLRRAGAVSTWEQFREVAAPAREESIDQLIQGVVIPA